VPLPPQAVNKAAVAKAAKKGLNENKGMYIS
jgi:hypothetical protein